jgi:hypothetical protein
MEASISLGQIRGIPIGLHYSWFIVFGLLTYSLAIGLFPTMYEGWQTETYWITAAIASLLLFVSVLLHELGHALGLEHAHEGNVMPTILLQRFSRAQKTGELVAEQDKSCSDEEHICRIGAALKVEASAPELECQQNQRQRCELHELHTDVEREQCGGQMVLRQADFLQRAGKPQPVQQTEGECRHPGGAGGQAGSTLTGGPGRPFAESGTTTRVPRQRFRSA